MAATSSSPVITWSGLKEDYELEEVIGEGATAVVQAAMYKPLQQKVAIKRINLENCSAGIDEIQKEIQAMYHCRHPNVVNYYTSFVVREELWLVMKLLSCGSALDIIKHQKSEGHVNGIFDESIVASILFEVLKGLEYFHSQGQMHRDLKAGNILVGEDGSIQIADFGVSAWLFEFGDRRKKMRNTFVGTPCWMAPEVMDQSVGYDSKADMWSFGILALELATGTAPYAKFPPMKILMLTMQEPPPTLETCENLHKQDYSKYSRQFRKMVDCCLKKDPQQRSTAAALLKNGFFKKAKPREYLCDKLVPQAPSFKSRAKAVKRVPGASGRLHRTEDGAWEWSDEECDTSVDTNGSARVNEPAKLTATNASPSNTNCATVPEDPRPAASVNVPQPPFKHTCGRESVASAGESSQSPGSDTAARTSPLLPVADGEIRLALRMRNRANKMQDIKFVYVEGKDTPDSLALELVTAGLLHKENQRTVAENIQRFHRRMPDEPPKLVFELPHYTTDHAKEEKALYGFAHLSLLGPGDSLNP